jgi:hypothetical protein
MDIDFVRYRRASDADRFRVRFNDTGILRIRGRPICRVFRECMAGQISDGLSMDAIH